MKINFNNDKNISSNKLIVKGKITIFKFYK